MMAILSLFSLSFLQSRDAGRTDPDTTTMAVKELLEKELVGTGIHGKTHRYFIDRDSLSDRYTFRSEADTSLSPATLTRICEGLNALLTGKQVTRGMGGMIFFDPYTDSVIVDVRYAKPDYFIFQAAKWIPVPPGGFGPFSKRVHDRLKNEIEHGRLRMEAFTDVGHLAFHVLQFGYRLQAPIADPLGGVMDGFWAEESQSRNWTNRIWSGPIPDVKVDLKVFPDYLKGTAGWPDSADWAVTHERVRLKGGLPLDELGQCYLTPVFNARLVNYATVSMVYDPMLESYRLPFAHNGSPEKLADLVKALELHRKNLGADASMTRVYFYRE